MNPFWAIERFCGEIVERGFARVFPSRLEPVQIARRLTSALESTSPPPTRYRVMLHPADLELLRPEGGDLIASWARMLTEMASHLGLPLAAEPQIELLDDVRSLRGQVRVEAEPGQNVMRVRVVRGIPANFAALIDRGLIVGRAPECEISLFDPSVSRRHARITRAGEQLTVEDLGSANGTFVGGRRVEHATLARGETLVVGNCELRVE